MANNSNYVIIDNNATAIQKILNDNTNASPIGLSVLSIQKDQSNAVSEITCPLGKLNESESLIGHTYLDYCLSTKVDKTQGKGLSSNDYSDAERNFLLYPEAPQNILQQDVHFKVDQNDPTIITEFIENSITNLTIITIPFGITKITGQLTKLLSNNISITVILPNSLEVIGDKVFENCTTLLRIKLSENLMKIGSYAFSGCSGLTDIILPETLQTIGDHAFYKCKKIVSMIVPEYITEVSESVFSDCYALKNIILPQGLQKIGYHAFSSCNNLTDINIPKTVERIGQAAFFACPKLKSIYIPRTTLVQRECFYGCSALKNIEFEDGYAYSIQYREFSNCNMTTLKIPDTVTAIDTYAFAGSSLEKIIIPNNITELRQGLFDGCKNLVMIGFDKQVKSIGNYVFRNCNALTHIYYGGSKEEWGQILISAEENGNDSIANAIIHYNSIIINDMDEFNKTIEYAQYPQIPKNCLVLDTDYIVDQETKTIITKFTDKGISKTGTITIPYGIEGIKEGELKTQATKLILPNSFKNFYDFMNITDCPNLKEIVIPTTIYLTK